MIICPHCGEVHRDDQKFCRNCGKPLKKSASWKKKLIVCIIIIFLIVVAGWYLLGGFTKESDEYNNPVSGFYSSDNDTVDEIIESPEEEVQYKRVDFNHLFNMYVFDNSMYEESTPQFNATYEWDDSINWGSGCNIYYYDQYDDINQLISVYQSHYPKMTYGTDGDLFIFTDSDSSSSYVGVGSPDNKFVIVGGAGELDTQKTLAKSIEFN